MTISSEERFFSSPWASASAARARHAASPRRNWPRPWASPSRTVQAYEAGSRRIPVSALPAAARALSAPRMALSGEQEQEPTTRRRRRPAAQWQQHIKAVARLPRAKQQFVAQMLQTVLAQAGVR
jgi:hypothetical protein